MILPAVSTPDGHGRVEVAARDASEGGDQDTERQRVGQGDADQAGVVRALVGLRDDGACADGHEQERAEELADEGVAKGSIHASLGLLVPAWARRSSVRIVVGGGWPASATLARMTALPGSVAPVDVTIAPDWWRRPGLDAVAGRLVIAGRDAEALARTRGTPRFVYDLERIRENARALHAAARRAGLDHRLRFALKANREPEVLAAMRGLGRPVSRTRSASTPAPG